MSDQVRVRGIRGAVTVAGNTREAIFSGTKKMLQLIMQENRLEVSDLVSALFTATPDLDAAFPAEAARELGWTNVPLLDASEIPVPGALQCCVRVLVHAYTARPPAKVRHIYLGEATGLRPDLLEQG